MKSEGATYVLIHTQCVLYMTAKYSCKIDDVHGIIIQLVRNAVACMKPYVAAPNCSVLS